MGGTDNDDLSEKTGGNTNSTFFGSLKNAAGTVGTINFLGKITKKNRDRSDTVSTEASTNSKNTSDSEQKFDKIDKLLNALTAINFELGNNNFFSLIGSGTWHGRAIHKRIKRIGDEEHLSRDQKEATLYYNPSYYQSQEFANYLVQNGIIEKFTNHHDLKNHLLKKFDFLNSIQKDGKNANIAIDIKNIFGTIANPDNAPLIRNLAEIAVSKLPKISGKETFTDRQTAPTESNNPSLEDIKTDNIKKQIEPYIPLIQYLGKNTDNLQNVINILKKDEKIIKASLDKAVSLAIDVQNGKVAKPEDIIAAAKAGSALLKPELIESIKPFIKEDTVDLIFKNLGKEYDQYKPISDFILRNRDAVTNLTKNLIEPLKTELQKGNLDKIADLAMRDLKIAPATNDEMIAAAKAGSALLKPELIENIKPFIKKDTVDLIFTNLGKEYQQYKPIADFIVTHKDAVTNLTKNLIEPLKTELQKGNLDKIADLAMRDLKIAPATNDEMIAAAKAGSALLKPELIENIKPFIKEDTVDLIFTNLGKEYQQYKPIAISLASNNEAVLDVIKEFVDKEKLQDIVGDMADLSITYNKKGIYSDEYKQKLEKVAISSVDLISTDVIAKGIGLINGDLVTAILNLPELKTTELDAEEEAKKIISKITEAMKDDEFKATIQDLIKNELPQTSNLNELWENWNKNIKPDTTDPNKIKDDLKKLKKIEKAIDDNAFKPTSKIMIKLADFVEELSKNTDNISTINKSISENSSNIIKSFEAFKNKEDNKYSQVVKMLKITGEEVVSLIPNSLTQEGLKSISDFMKKPGIVNGAKMVYHTKTLGFGLKKVGNYISHQVAQIVPDTLSWVKRVTSPRRRSSRTP